MSLQEYLQSGQAFFPLPKPLQNYLAKDAPEFLSRCHEYDQRAGIALFGLDFIIDREGEIHCLEINGQYSGTAGFEQAYGTDWGQQGILNWLSSFDLPVSIYTPGDKEYAIEDATISHLREIRQRCLKKALQKTLNLPSEISDQEFAWQRQRLGRFHPIFEGHFRMEFDLALDISLSRPDHYFTFTQAPRIVWNNTGYCFQTEGLMLNSPIIEAVLKEKSWTSFLMYPAMQDAGMIIGNPLEELPPYHDALSRYLRRAPDFIVMKPTDEACGQGVMVLPKDLFLNAAGTFRLDAGGLESWLLKLDPEERSELLEVMEKKPTWMLGHFFPSKPYLSPQTGKLHQGCIRYILGVQRERGKTTLQHIGGYVRLAAEPFSEDHSSRIANISKGGHGIPLSKRDAHRLEAWTNRYIPSFFRRLMRAEGEKMGGCDTTLINFLAVEEFERFYR